MFMFMFMSYRVRKKSIFNFYHFPYLNIPILQYGHLFSIYLPEHSSHITCPHFVLTLLRILSPSSKHTIHYTTSSPHTSIILYFIRHYSGTSTSFINNNVSTVSPSSSHKSGACSHYDDGTLPFAA